MARRKRAAAEPLPAGLTPEVLDQLVAGVQTSADLQLVWRRLQKTMAECVLKAELTHHLGYPEGGERRPDGNARNGFTPKSLLTESGAIALDIPRDRDGSFTHQFVPKGARRLPDGAHALRTRLEHARALGRLCKIVDFSVAAAILARPKHRP